MQTALIRNFDQEEKIALLKLMIKIAGADKKFSKEELSTIKDYLSVTKIKISQKNIQKTLAEKTSDIINAFKSKSNLNRALQLLEQYTEKHGVDPEYEHKILSEIRGKIVEKKKTTKFSLKDTIALLPKEFGYLWGQEDLNPKLKLILALLFTIAACGFGSVWTNKYGFVFEKTEAVSLNASSVIPGIFIYCALAFRNYLPSPIKPRNIFFCIADLYLFSLIAMHIIGRGGIEKSITFMILIGLIVLLWLGMKEILGFVLIGLFALFIYKILAIDTHMSWRAFPFLVFAFIGVSFQSNNFFDEVGKISSSFLKKPNVEKELIKNSLVSAGTSIRNTSQKAISVGVKAAAGLPPV